AAGSPGPSYGAPEDDGALSSLPEPPQPPRTLPPRPGALAQPVLPVRPVAATAAAIDPFRPGFGVEHRHISQTALFVVLQLHALATAHFGQFSQGEDQRLDVLPDDGDVVRLRVRGH